MESWELRILKNFKSLGNRQIRDLNNLVQVNDVFSKLYRYGLINPSYDLVSDTVTIDIQGQFVYLFKSIWTTGSVLKVRIISSRFIRLIEDVSVFV